MVSIQPRKVSVKTFHACMFQATHASMFQQRAYAEKCSRTYRSRVRTCFNPFLVRGRNEARRLGEVGNALGIQHHRAFGRDTAGVPGKTRPTSTHQRQEKAHCVSHTQNGRSLQPGTTRTRSQEDNGRSLATYSPVAQPDPHTTARCSYGHACHSLEFLRLGCFVLHHSSGALIRQEGSAIVPAAVKPDSVCCGAQFATAHVFLACRAPCRRKWSASPLPACSQLTS